MAAAVFNSPVGREHFGNDGMKGVKPSRRRVFVQTETGCVLGMDLDQGDNAHTLKRRLQIALNVPVEGSSLAFGDMVLKNDLSAVRNDSPLLLTRNHIHRCSSSPCLSPTGKDMQQRDQSGPIEILGHSVSFKKTKQLVKEIVKAMKVGVEAIPVQGGLAGAYYFRNSRGESVAIVKPTDEEPFAPNNPKGFVGRALVLAVTTIPTSLQKSRSILASLLRSSISHDFDASDHGTSSFPVSAVHRIGFNPIHRGRTQIHLEDLNPYRDAEMLKTELRMIREACLRVLIVCKIFLKEAAAYGLTLAEIGEMMRREFRRGEEEPTGGGGGNVFKYPTMTKTGAGFKLKVVEGEFTDSEVIVLLGAHGTGKSIFLRLLRGLMEPDDTADGSKVNIPKYYSSHKPQMRIEPYVRSVSSALHDEIPYTYLDPVFVSQVMEPLQIDQLMDTSLCDLSDNESQRLALCLCLGRRAHIYLIDEPSANLTPQQRIVAARVIKRFIQRTNSTAFVVAHDFAMVEHLADKVIVFEGTPSVDCVAHAPQPWNLFLARFDGDADGYCPRLKSQHSSITPSQAPMGFGDATLVKEEDLVAGSARRIWVAGIFERERDVVMECVSGWWQRCGVGCGLEACRAATPPPLARHQAA
ncbi:phosphoinositide 4-kinase gamma 7 [Artemisia annua]|uniref:1-phosphatidylinositol 4-kinase n=1 Tax=Artemisia annua TaxID=35608 RepID=A0A2U1Q0X2_ARTAN|nr:phosphoinositide 4-kinase gamma 7 [Artemisia annua]